MTQRSAPKMGNFTVFIFLAFGILMLNALVFNPPKPPADKPAAEQAEAEDGDKKGDKKKVAKDEPGEKKPAADKPDDKEKPTDKAKPADKKADKAEAKKPEEKPAAEKVDKEALKGDFPKTKPEERRITLGSADPDSPYRMLVMLTDRGAAVERIELNSPRYVALTDPSGFLSETAGYLGHLALDDTTVRVVGTGTPAAKAGLKPGDRIEAIDGKETATQNAITEIMTATKPGDVLELSIVRDSAPQKLTATLGRFPLEVVRPETMKRLEDSDEIPTQDPLSYLLTMAQIGDEELPRDQSRPRRQDGCPPGIRQQRAAGVEPPRWHVGDR